MLEKIRCKAEAKIVVEVTKAFLQKDNTEMEKIGIRVSNFRDAYQARNDFYQKCLDDRNVQGVGFDDTDNFPINRSDFVALYVNLPPKEAESDDEPWQVSVETLSVTSPNWDQSDQAKRQWKGKDLQGKERLFVVEDEGFWNLVKEDRLSLHAIDAIKVQWAFHEAGGRRKNFRVLRVIEYNGQHLADPLDDNALHACLGEYGTKRSNSTSQGTLFD